MAKMPLAELLPRVEPVLEGAGLWDEAFAAGGTRHAWFLKTVDLIRARFVTLLDFADAGRAYFDDTFDMDPEAVDKNLKKEPHLKEWLPELARRFEAVPDFARRLRRNGPAGLRRRAGSQGGGPHQRRAHGGHRPGGRAFAVRGPGRDRPGAGRGAPPAARPGSSRASRPRQPHKGHCSPHDGRVPPAERLLRGGSRARQDRAGGPDAPAGACLRAGPPPRPSCPGPPRRRRPRCR